jgi:hypothetical protein
LQSAEVYLLTPFLPDRTVSLFLFCETAYLFCETARQFLFFLFAKLPPVTTLSPPPTHSQISMELHNRRKSTSSLLSNDDDDDDDPPPETKKKKTTPKDKGKKPEDLGCLVTENLLDSNIHLLINAHKTNALGNTFALLRDKFDVFAPDLTVIVNDRLVYIKETLEDKRLACNQAYTFSEEVEQRFARELTAKKLNGEYSISTTVLPAILLTC